MNKVRDVEEGARGIVIGDTPHLTLFSEDWDMSVTTGLEFNVWSWLEYYFEEPKSTKEPSSIKTSLTTPFL